MRTACWSRPSPCEPVQRVEGGEVPHVVTGERGGHEPGAELLDDVALVDRDRRAELRRHLRRMQLQARPRRPPGPPRRPPGSARSGRWRQWTTTATPSLRSTSTPGSSRVAATRGRLDRSQVRLDPRVGDHLPADPALQPVLARRRSRRRARSGHAGTRPVDRSPPRRDRPGPRARRARHARPGSGREASGSSMIGASDPSKSTSTAACAACSTSGRSAASNGDGLRAEDDDAARVLATRRRRASGSAPSSHCRPPSSRPSCTPGRSPA